MFAHFGKHLLHIGKPKRFFPLPLQLLDRVKLLHCDDVAFNPVWLVEIGDRIGDESVSDGGRKI